MNNNKIILCANCLDNGAVDVPVGHERGSQRDPWRASIALCPVCSELLTSGALGLFARRFARQKTISRVEE